MTVRIVIHREPREGRSTPWRAAQWFFLGAGLLGVGYAAYTETARYFYQAYAIRTFERSVAQGQPAAASPSLIGKLAIRRLGIAAIVKEGVDDGTLWPWAISLLRRCLATPETLASRRIATPCSVT